MKRIARWLSVMVVAGLSLTAEAGPITYSINRSIGTFGSVVGTLTTDGTIGVVKAANILEWDLFLNADANTATVAHLYNTSAALNSSLFFSFPSTALTATSNG